MTDAFKPPLRVISLGAGVQSSTMLLMAARGDFGPLPHTAVFADTQWEPAGVYRHLEWLEATVGAIIPIIRTTRGNIRTGYVAPWGDVAKRYVQLPVFVKNPDGTQGMGRRQCTREFKLDPIRQAVRRLMASYSLRPKPGVVEQWIGISRDEAHRMKDSGVQYAVNVYPLVDAGITRLDCVKWLRDNGYPIPPKSACLGCPYHSNTYWRNLRDQSPDEWSDVVKFDQEIRNGVLRGELRGENYIHRSLIPLDQVDLRTNTERGQRSLFDDEPAFGNECEGLCGV